MNYGANILYNHLYTIKLNIVELAIVCNHCSPCTLSRGGVREPERSKEEHLRLVVPKIQYNSSISCHLPVANLHSRGELTPCW